MALVAPITYFYPSLSSQQCCNSGLVATVKATAVAAVVVGTEVARVLSDDTSSYTSGCSNDSGRDCSYVGSSSAAAVVVAAVVASLLAVAIYGSRDWRRERRRMCNQQSTGHTIDRS